MSPRMSEAHVQARREQILDAALRSFGRNGFHATTMQDIATEAGLSPGALYRYFPGKTDIVAALAKQHRERNLAIFATADAGAETATMFRHLGEAFFRQFEEPDFADWLPINIELWAESIRSDEVRQVMRESLATSQALVVELVRGTQARGDIDPSLDAPAVVQLLMSMFIGLQVQRVVAGEIDIQPYLEAVLAMVTGNFWRGAPNGGRDAAAIRDSGEAKSST